MRITKFMGKHIDLDSIVAISDAQFNDHYGAVAMSVTCELDIKLRDKPITFSRYISYKERKYECEIIEGGRYPSMGRHLILTTDGTYRDVTTNGFGNIRELAPVANLQHEINKLIAEWIGPAA